MAKKTIKQADYRKSQRCPHCGTEPFFYDQFQYNDDPPNPRFWRRATCGSCRRTWKEIFTLKGFEEET